jgi:hypothetical protein
MEEMCNSYRSLFGSTEYKISLDEDDGLTVKFVLKEADHNRVWLLAFVSTVLNCRVT